MRILYCNKYNFLFSGTEAYLFDAMRLMRSGGHQTALFSMADSRGADSSADQYLVPHVEFKGNSGWLEKMKLGAHALYSLEARRKMRSVIEQFRPDVAHVRNIYHHLSPSILWELKKQSIPVIYHLNDFKVLCPSYNLVSQGQACEACKGGHFWHALPQKCYSGLGPRAALVAEAYFHRALGTYRRCVDCFLAPSQFVRDKFVEHGWDPARFVVLPHFQAVNTKHQVRHESDAAILYFGRLSPEKGIDDLLRAMQLLPEFRLTIAGDGPERPRLEALASALQLRNVEFLGHTLRPELAQLIAKSRFTVLPSHAYETFGKTILESYAHGKAVVASDLGSRRELVEHGETGLLYETGNVSQLASAMKMLADYPEFAEKMGAAGQKRARDRYTPEFHYQSLVELYERTVKRKLSMNLRTRPRPVPLPSKPSISVAFIGGRGVVSKYSGIETYYEEVGGRLAEMGHEVTVYCRSYFTPRLKSHKGMNVVRLPTIRSKHLETLLHTFLSTIHAMKQPFDIVHYHALGPALFSFLPRLAGKKTVVTVQGLDWQRKKWGWAASKVLRLGEYASVKLPNATVVVSQTLQRRYRDHDGAETHYVPNGGLLRHRSPEKQISEWGLKPDDYILFLGRFSPEKGCHLLIEAYERIRPGPKLVLAGGASYCDDYARQLRDHGSEQIKILDWVSGEELDELLTNSMIFVLPSDLEGLSLALLDAMGAGLCVLASDVPENREAMEGVGFTFRRGDVSDLADRLQFLLSNPTVREAAGVAAKQRVREEYQWAGVAEGTALVYEKVLGRKTLTAVKKPSGRVGVTEGVPLRKII